MNIELLIPLVEERKSLWDTSCKSYHNRDINRKHWNEIAQIMQLESGVVKTKWANLRDMFRKEHTKQSKQPTGSEAKKVPTWRYYEQLSFLRDVIKPRKMIGNIDPCENRLQSENIGDNEVKEHLSPQSVDSGSDITQTRTATDSATGTNPSGTYGAPVLKKAKISKSNTLAEFLALEAKKVAHLEQIRKASTSSNEVQDEDYHFLMSLLPHFRAIPAQRKLAVRTRIQQVLMEEEEGHYSRNSPAGTTKSQHEQHSSILPSWQEEADYECDPLHLPSTSYSNV